MNPSTATAKWLLPSVLFEVTSVCNLKCRYCYNVHKRPGGELPTRGNYGSALRTLRRLFDIAEVESVTFSGGEPFLAERFVDTVRFVREEGKGVLITSNGNGGSDEQYIQLTKLGVATFVMPFHSILQKEHDAMTGVSGSQERALLSLLTLQQLGVTPTPIIVLTRENVTSVARTMIFLARQGFRRMIVNRFNYGGMGIVEADRLALSVPELRQAYDVVNMTAERCGLWVSSNVCTPHCVLNPNDYPRIGFGACDIHMENRPVTLDARGNVRFCNHSPVVMGNIFEQRLDEILSTPYAKKWERTVPDFCSDCSKWEVCVGGCRAASEQMGRDMTFVDPIATLIRAGEYQIEAV